MMINRITSTEDIIVVILAFIIIILMPLLYTIGYNREFRLSKCFEYMPNTHVSLAVPILVSAIIIVLVACGWTEAMLISAAYVVWLKFYEIKHRVPGSW